MTERRYQVCGEVDLSTADVLQDKLMVLVAVTTDDIVLDCERLEFIDSIGILVFVRVQRLLEERGRQCAIVNMRRGVRRPFDVLGLTEVLGIQELEHS